MAATKYTYSIASDFPGTGLDASRMVVDVQASSIVTALDRIDTDDDACDIWFKDALSAGDRTTLDNDATGPSGGLIAAHTGLPLVEVQKVHSVSAVGAELPATSDGKPIITASLFPEWAVETIVGVGDDVGAGTIGTGQKFQMSEDQTATDEVIEFQFTCSVFIAAGGGWFKGAVLGDCVTMEVYAPSTTTTPNTDLGNCDLTDVGGGLNLITPAAGDGSHDIDMDQAVLVPSPDVTGYWDWDEPKTGRGTITASGTPGAAAYNLFDANLNIARFAGFIPLLGDGQASFGVQNIKAKKLLPHWKNKVILHNKDGSHTVEFVFFMVLGRATTI